MNPKLLLLGTIFIKEKITDCYELNKKTIKFFSIHSMLEFLICDYIYYIDKNRNVGFWEF